MLDVGVNAVGYRVQVKPKDEGWYCLQEDGDERCINTIRIHQKTEGVEGVENN